ncbi:hypothetical protein [Mycobacteroides sp. LB1]|uniref:hypothetical protein n=1 Tax=Mycobacteroides sp. LB1 TaxID=2750814 RepID=UPI0015DDFD0B|nr:hypothetical protein [Mycobacteroides sp. LB1]
MPDLKVWAGQSHDAAVEMFGRTRRYAADMADYATDIGHALGDGSTRIGNARSALLDKANEIDQGQFHVTDQWVVLIKPAQMTAEQAAALKQQAQADQLRVDQLLLTVGEADDATADAMQTAAKKHGFEPNPLTGLVIPKPSDEVPNPSTPLGIIQQQSILKEDMGVTVRDRQESEPDAQGTKTITLTMQDGSKQVETDFGFQADRSKADKVQIQHFAADGSAISTTTSWKDWDGTKNTEVDWPNQTFVNMREYKDGTKTAWVTTADGKSAEVPPYKFLAHPVASSVGGALTAIDKASETGIPFLGQEAVEKVGVGARFAGPALGIGMTLYDMANAQDPTEACVAGISGGFGVAGAWGGGAVTGLLGIESGPLDVAVAGAGSVAGEQLFGWVGDKVGRAVCGG